MLNNKVNFDFSIMKKLLDLPLEKLVNTYNRVQVGMAFWINIHGCQPYLEIAIYVVNQLKNDS